MIEKEQNVEPLRRQVREDKKQSLTEHTGYTEKGEKVED